MVSEAVVVAARVALETGRREEAVVRGRQNVIDIVVVTRAHEMTGLDVVPATTR